MRILEDNEVWLWCAERGIQLNDKESRPTEDPSLGHRLRAQYATGKKSRQEAAFASACVQALGQWDECLLWITLWGVWPSCEDWPRFYNARGQRGARRSLDVAPGHLFGQNDASDLIEFLTMVFEFAWDAFVLPAYVGVDQRMRIEISHDDWLELRSTLPIEFTAPAIEPRP